MPKTQLVDLTPYHRNPREGDVGAITQSLQQLGQYRPIVVNKGTKTGRQNEIAAGNHTYKAAAALGWDQIDVTWIDVDDDTLARIVLVDNRTNDLATYDAHELTELLTELAGTDLGLAATGYNDAALDELLQELNEPLEFKEGREGNMGAYPDNPEAAIGDAWHLGPHILVCGDATDAASYEALPEPAALVWTDPPYGVDLQARNEDLQKRTGAKGKNLAPVTADSVDEVNLDTLWTESFVQCRAASHDSTSIYMCAPGGLLGQGMAAAAITAGWDIRHGLVWVKNNHVLGRADYHYRHEGIFYGWNKKHTWYGDRSQTSVFEVPKPQSHEHHPTSKPVALIEPMITNSTKPGDWILDPFAGSGSTLIAADNLNRRSYLIELDPGYCDVIINRWESLNPDNKPDKL